MLAAETLAELIGTSPETQVTIVIAVEPLRTDSTDYDEEIIARQNAKMRERAHAVLATTARVFDKKSIKHVTKVVEGDPVSVALAREAQAGSYSVIAMGSRGLGMQKDDLHYLGSVTEHVIRRVRIPVLVIPVQNN
jgi:nucleotide-binding universal stress UspA family protein